jgi:hypothetical protein
VLNAVELGVALRVTGTRFPPAEAGSVIARR